MRLIALRRVDFPDPEGPIKAVISLGWKDKETLFKAFFDCSKRTGLTPVKSLQSYCFLSIQSVLLRSHWLTVVWHFGKY